MIFKNRFYLTAINSHNYFVNKSQVHIVVVFLCLLLNYKQYNLQHWKANDLFGYSEFMYEKREMRNALNSK